MKTLTNSLFVIVLFGAIASSCSKSDNSPGKSSVSYTEPALAKDSLVKIPSAINTKATSNLNLYNLTISTSFVNTFSSGLAAAFIYDQNTVDGWKSTSNSDGSTTYSFSYLQFGVNLTYYQSTGNSWWKYSYDSASYTMPIYYIQDKGTSGEIDWYNWGNNYKSTSILALKDTWTKSGSTTNSTFNEYENDGVTLLNQYVSTSNADRSGSMNILGQNSPGAALQMQWKYTWNSNGTGTYTRYDTDGTTVLSSGTF